MRSMREPLDFTTEQKYMRHQALLVSILDVVYHACYNILLLIVHVQLCRHIFYNQVSMTTTPNTCNYILSAEKVCEGRLFRFRAR